MRRLGIAAVLVLAVVLFVLTVAQHDERGAGALAATGTQPAEALMRADAAFDQATAEKGIEGWLSFFAEDGAMMPAGEGIVRGHDAIRGTMGPVLAAPGHSLRWKPTSAEIAASEDLGYTFGTFTSTSPGPNGESTTRHGKYVTIWKKQADGSWKVVMDIGNSSPATQE